MRKLVGVAVVFLLVAGLSLVAYRMGWLARVVPGAAPGGSVQRAGTGPSPSPADAGAAAAPTADARSDTANAAADTATGLPPFDGNIAAHEWGGKMESVTGADEESEWNLSAPLRGQGFGTGRYGPGPKDLVISFFGREAAVVDRVEIVRAQPAWPRQVEVWTSMSGPAAGFTRVAAATLEDRDANTVRFDPVEARFVKVRMTENGLGDDGAFDVEWIKVFEAQRAGYVPLLSRRREIVDPLAGTPGAAPVKTAAAAACTVEPETPLAPGRTESRKVLVLTDEGLDTNFSWTALKKEDPKTRAQRSPDLAVFDRLQLDLMATPLARPYHLSKQYGYDTIVLEQACGGQANPFSPAFRPALVAWVAAGHKLIIHDADKCAPGPDYAWLPYRFKTDNPGAQGADGDTLKILEDNWMVHNRKGVPGYVDTAAWVAGTDLYRNELGDSNTVTDWDRRWCGQIVVKNVNEVFGFAGAYAHYGRGLIVYNGFDIDMAGTTGYDVLIAREMAQGFDPDNLPCSAPIGHFVVTTDPALRYRALAPGRSLAYPLTLLSNQKYQGNVTLSLSSSPAVPGLQASFQPSTVSVSNSHPSALTVTLPPSVAAKSVALEVKGTAADGKTNSLCLQLGPPRVGELSVVSSVRPPNRGARNLEIILDASGSMKTPLAGKRTRWDVALDTLRLVLEKLPDDFHVGLRIYGHREGSRSPKTCTDSELIVPIGPLDRATLFDKAKAFQPKGETPLVYSALQAPQDLKSLGGGTVILITDGEESCKGDMSKAASDLKASGLDIRLSIVGFTLKNAKAQADLTAFARATGGRFYSAQDGEALAGAVLIAAIDKFPFTVHDAAGKIVAEGEAGGAPTSLPPGDYKVVVNAGGLELVAPRVRVDLGGAATVTIARKGDQLVLQ